MIDIEVKGLSELKATLRTLPAAIQNRVMRSAVATAAGVFKDEAVLLAPMYTGSVQAGHPPPGTLKQAIYITRMVSQCTSTLEMWKVDVRRNAAKGKTKGVGAFYASWVEYGHFTRTPGLSKRAHGAAVAAGMAGGLGAKWVSAKPYMRPAFESVKEQAALAMRDKMAQRIDDAVQAAKRGGA